MQITRRPSLIVLAMAILPSSQSLAQPANGWSDPNAAARAMDGLLPLVRGLEACVTSPGVADPDCVGSAMKYEIHKRYGDLKPGQQTPDQGARNFDRFFGGNLSAPYADPGQSSRDDDGFLRQYNYGLRGLLNPGQPSGTSPGAPGTE